MNNNPIVTFEMKDGDVFYVELYPDVAPNTVNNFISLVKKGFYNGLCFHRVIEGFMIQGGDPKGNGTGGPGYTIRGEFSKNGFKNDLKHKRGVISMARSMLPNSAGSQFFIMHADAPHLDGQYAAFGQVIDGMDVIDKIAEVNVDYNDKPLRDQVIKTVTVDTNGVEYDEPEHY
ncbi:MAG: peptidylprolyl isomerase [Clostridia bacterium]|nr:peptidylprolyl isomerase [Clostridiales bacterium]MDD7166091.1 peptidylprolyl isomerase [Clostridia bacterium]MDY2900953.1 peptidylprolyl isomerase [Christensenellaceae bacterium]